MFGPFTVAETFEQIAEPLSLDRRALLQLTRNGLRTAFITEERRALLLKKVES